MRPRLIAAIAALSLCIATLAAGEAISHRFVVVDNGGNKLVLVDQREPAKGWSVTIPGGSRDAQAVANDRVLVSHGTGAAEYALADGKKAWSVDTFKGVSTARRLPSGTTILGMDGAGGCAIAEVDTAGKEIGRITVAGTSALRLMRRLDNGHTLLGLAEPKQVVEADAAGKVVAQWKLPGKGYLAERLASGHTLASNGDAVSVQELDASGAVVKEWGGAKTHGSARLLWFSGFQRLANGNVVVANWCGHGLTGKGPHVVEFDAANTLVWQWEDHTAAKSVTNVLVIE